MPDQPNTPVPALGGMKAPCGSLEVIQFAVLNAGAAEMMNSPITTSLIATIQLLNRAVSRMPMTRSALTATMISAAGTFSTAPVSDHAWAAESYSSGEDANREGMFSPKSLARLTTYPDQ